MSKRRPASDTSAAMRAIRGRVCCSSCRCWRPTRAASTGWAARIPKRCERRRQLGSPRLVTALGLPFFWLPPLVLVLVLAAWNLWRQADKPGDLVGVLTGMALESVAFALGLWGLAGDWCRLCTNSVCKWRFPARRSPALRQVVTYLGAGIYEEALFRLTLYSGMVWLLRRMEAPKMLAMAPGGHGVGHPLLSGPSSGALRTTLRQLSFSVSHGGRSLLRHALPVAAASASPSERTPATT